MPAEPRAMRMNWSSVMSCLSFAAIARLLRRCSPSAVIGGIAAIIIAPIYRMISTWAIPHIGDKPFKGKAPFIANGNTSAAVVREGVMIRIGAAFFHSGPDFIIWVLSKFCLRPILLASARNRCAALKKIRSGDFFPATGARTDRHQSSFDKAHLSDCQSPESLSQNSSSNRMLRVCGQLFLNTSTRRSDAMQDGILLSCFGFSARTNAKHVGLSSFAKGRP